MPTLTYTVKRSTSPTGPWTPIATGLTVKSYTDPMTTADDGVTYYYEVFAVSPGGTGNALGPISVATVCKIIITPPSGWTPDAHTCAGWQGASRPCAGWQSSSRPCAAWTQGKSR